jgi:3-oxoacyl-[acyl-carrier protein] reductase
MAADDRRLAVVTGGSGGIGSATCRLFVARGWDVAVLDQPASSVAGEELAAELGGDTRALFVPVDVGSPAGIAAAFAAVRAWRPACLDAFVSMAALFTYGEVQDVSVDAWDAVLSVNVRGTALCCAEAVRDMRAAAAAGRCGGAIVLVSSITATLAFPAFVPYSATKAALLQMTRDIALDNGRFGIRVNCCAPGPIFTQGGTVAHAAREGRDVSALAAELARDVSLRRMGTPDECARAIYFLCSEDAAYVTGTTLHVDGGFCRK